MRRLVYLAAAANDLVKIFEHVRRQSGSDAVGRRFVGQLRQQCSKLASLPGTLGRARPELRPDIRSFAFHDYVIFFRYEGESLVIVDILEGHRDIGSYFAHQE